MMELFVAWIPLLALVGLALTIWCLYQRFRRAALGWAAATVCILLCAVWWYAPFHVRLAAEESVLVNYEDDRHSERLVPGRDDPALAQLTEQVEALSFRQSGSRPLISMAASAPISCPLRLWRLVFVMGKRKSPERPVCGSRSATGWRLPPRN